MKILSFALLSLLFFSFLPSGKNILEDKSRAILEKKFDNPPVDARLRAYWWWVNGNVTKESIKRDLEEMKAKGFGGAVLCDMDRSYVGGNLQVPHGPDFMSSEWRELYRYTLNLASNLGLEISLNISSGWAMGGPMIKMEDAPKKLVWNKFSISGPVKFNKKLEKPVIKQVNVFPRRAHEKPGEITLDSLYSDVFVVAYPLKKTPQLLRTGNRRHYTNPCTPPLPKQKYCLTKPLMTPQLPVSASMRSLIYQVNFHQTAP